MFGSALEKYNEKQKRNDRKIKNYYEKIRTSKQEKLFYEIVVQVGNCDDMDSKSADGELAKTILDKYMNDFEKHNPNLYVFASHLHMDEATPHLHIDYIPVSFNNNNRGLETKNSLKGALTQQGFKGGTKESTELTQWQNSEKQRLADIMLEHGIEWEKKNTHETHLSVENFKKKMRTEEVAILDEEINQKNEILTSLSDKEVELNNNIEAKKESVSFQETKLDNYMKRTHTISGDVRAIEETYKLPTPSAMMTAKYYHDKKAYPLLQRLKEEINNLIIQFVNLKQAHIYLTERHERLNNKYDYLSNKYDGSKYKVRYFDVLEKIFGIDKINNLVTEHDEQVRQEQLAKRLNKNKNRGNER